MLSPRVMSKRVVGWALACAMSGSSGFAAAQEPLVIVEGGVAAAVIVLPDMATRQAPEAKERRRMEDQAAMLLKDHLERMSGATVQVKREQDLGNPRIEDGRVVADTVKVPTYILVGNGALAAALGVTEEGLTMGGLAVKTTGNALVLLGPPEGTPYTGGTIYAVTEFLEGQGVRYLWPGPVGHVIPKRQTIVVEPVDRRYSPPVRHRHIRIMAPNNRLDVGAKELGFSNEQWGELMTQATTIPAQYTLRTYGGWAPWMRLGGDLGILGGHAFGDAWEKWGAEHPEWFALQFDGTRDQTGSAERERLCVSNPGLQQAIADEIIAAAHADPGKKSFSLSPNDGGASSFCMCDACKALDPPDAPKVDMLIFEKVGESKRHAIKYPSLSDRYAHFWNAIAEKVTAVHPDLLLVVDAYSYFSSPPLNHTHHPNLVLRYVPPTMDDWEEWSTKSSKIYWRPNNLFAPRKLGALLVSREWADDLKFAATHGMVATDFDSILHNWATHGLGYYFVARLMWDPSLELDDIVADYCQAGFGPAAEPVHAYFKRALDLTARRWDIRQTLDKEGAKVVMDIRTDPFVEVYTPRVVAELQGHLDAARSAASSDEEVAARVAFLQTGLDWTDVQARALRLVSAFQQEQRIDWAEADRVLNERDALMRRIFLEQPLAVNVAYLTWAEGNRWAALEKAIRAWKMEKGIAVDEPVPGNSAGGTVIDADEAGRPVEVKGRK